MATQTEYIGVTATAKLIRKALARKFPGVKFSVRSNTYSMGASIDVRWIDGPRSKLVESITHPFSGDTFDGMIDMKVQNKQWLHPDGTASLAYQPNTNGSLTEIVTDAPAPNARLVHFGADFVFCHRSVSNFDQQVEEAKAMIRQQCRCDGNPPHDRFGSRWVKDLASNMVYDHSEGEPIEEPFKRVVLME